MTYVAIIDTGDLHLLRFLTSNPVRQIDSDGMMCVAAPGILNERLFLCVRQWPVVKGARQPK